MRQNTQLIGVVFALGEFESAFPEIWGRGDLTNSDRVRVALGLGPRNAPNGAPKGNRNAIGNRGRWQPGTSGYASYLDKKVIDGRFEWVDVSEVYIKDPNRGWAIDRTGNGWRSYFNPQLDKRRITWNQVDFDQEKYVEDLAQALRELGIND